MVSKKSKKKKKVKKVVVFFFFYFTLFGKNGHGVGKEGGHFGLGMWPKFGP